MSGAGVQFIRSLAKFIKSFFRKKRHAHFFALVQGDSATVFIDTEFKGNLQDMKQADAGSDLR